MSSQTLSKQTRQIGSLGNQLARRIALLSLIAFLGLGATVVAGLGSTLQNTQRQLDEAGSTAARAFGEFLSGIKSDLLATSDSLTTTSDAEAVLRRTLARQSAIFELLLVDPRGQVLTQRRRVGEVQPQLAEQPWLATVQAGEVYIGPVDYGEYGVPFVDLAVAATDEAGNFSATLLARVDLTALWDTVIGLRIGETGYVYIADEKGQLLAYRDLQFVRDGVTVEELTGRAPPAIAAPGFHAYVGVGGDLVLASGVPLSAVPWFAIVEQPLGEVLRSLVWLAAGLFALLLVVGLLVYSIIRFTRRRIVSPLALLRDGVERLREGNMEYRIAISTQDELGALANTFNVMAARLQEMIGTLEQRVAERTRDLERRAMQVEAAATVARDAAAIRDVDALLEETVHLISDRFGFYHAGLFLVDEAREYAVLQAASSEGGEHMLARGHKLKIGEVGIVGNVAGSGEPRIALDVGEDATYFNNPDLPQTRSEMALPLKAREQVIGVLDVQSTEAEAFTDEDVGVLQIMADQVTLAIENARLLEESQRTVQELRIAQGEYISSAWERLEQLPAFVYDQVEVTSTSPDLIFAKEILRARQAVMVSESENGQSALTAPLRLRDQTIGAISLEETTGDRQWTEDEIELVEAVSEQVALALENARLFTETQKTAQRMAALYEMSRAISSYLEEKPLMRATLEAVYRTLNCEYALISTVDEEAKTIGVRYGIWKGEFDAFPEWIEKAQYPLDHPDIIADVYRTGRTEIIEGWDERFNREIYDQYGHERLLRIFMPIKVRDRITGVIEASYDKQEKSQISDEEAQILATFMDQAAVALENARLFRQAQQRAQRERQTYEITDRIRRSLDIPTILQAAVDELGRTLQTDRVLVRLMTRQGAGRAERGESET